MHPYYSHVRPLLSLAIDVHLNAARVLLIFLPRFLGLALYYTVHWILGTLMYLLLWILGTLMYLLLKLDERWDQLWGYPGDLLQGNDLFEDLFEGAGAVAAAVDPEGSDSD